MQEFIKIDKLGTLQIDKILFESHYPILFTCINEINELFLCTCCQVNKKGKKWLLTKTTPQNIIKILKNEITLREAFLQFNSIQYTIYSNSEGITVIENDLNDWNYENSIYLPDKDEYMEAEDGEFDEEITYYEKFSNDIYKKIKSEKVYISSIDKLIGSELINSWNDICSTINIRGDAFNHSQVFKQTFNSVLEIYINKSETSKINYNINDRIENSFKKASAVFFEAKSFAQGYTVYQKEDNTLVGAA